MEDRKEILQKLQFLEALEDFVLELHVLWSPERKRAKHQSMKEESEILLIDQKHIFKPNLYR